MSLSDRDGVVSEAEALIGRLVIALVKREGGEVRVSDHELDAAEGAQVKIEYDPATRGYVLALRPDPDPEAP
jgi:hypothetical protein